MPHMRAETAAAFRMCRSHERANRRRSSAIGSLLHPADGLQSIGGCQQTDDAAFRSRGQQLQLPSPSHMPHMRAETAVAFRMCRSHERANRRLSSAISSLLHPVPARPGTAHHGNEPRKHCEGCEGLPVLRGAGLGADVCRRPRALRKRVQDRVRAWEG